MVQPEVQVAAMLAWRRVFRTGAVMSQPNRSFPQGAIRSIAED